MSPRRSRKLSLFLSTLLVFSLIAAACGDDDDDDAGGGGGGGGGTEEEAPASGEPGSFAAEHYTTDLSADCPNPIVVQKDWLAEAEHAAMYQMIGGGGEMSSNVYSGPLGSTGVDLEILDGGPGLGDGISTMSSLYAGNLVLDKEPMLAFVGSDDSAQFSDEFPTTGVFAPLAKQPTMLMYDPENYQDLETLQDVIDTGADVYVTSKSLTYVQYLINQGLPEDRIIEGYSGDKEKFITSGGKLINQGYVSNEVYSYENETETWNKPVDYVLIYDLGFQPYPSVLSVRSDKLEEYSPCLEKLVPIMQQAQADYMADPSEVNELLAEYNPDNSAPYWFTSLGLNDAAVEKMTSEGIVEDEGAGLGAMDEERTQELIDILIPIFGDQGIDSYADDLSPDTIMTNEFTDPDITLE